MYSRKFNGIQSLPPDYSGVALRRNKVNEQSHTEKNTDQELSDNSYGTYPRYPVYEEKRLNAANPPTEKDECTAHQGEENSLTAAPESLNNKKKYYSSFSNKSFSLEDIVLAGIILLILNEDERDDGLLLILGFLLLIGMK